MIIAATQDQRHSEYLRFPTLSFLDKYNANICIWMLYLQSINNKQSLLQMWLYNLPCQSKSKHFTTFDKL